MDRVEMLRSGVADPEIPVIDARVRGLPFREIHQFTHQYVEPARRLFGHEAEGLPLAQLLIERAETTPMLDAACASFVHAMYANGQEEKLHERIQSGEFPPNIARYLTHVAGRAAPVVAQVEASRADVEKEFATLEQELAHCSR